MNPATNNVNPAPIAGGPPGTNVRSPHEMKSAPAARKKRKKLVPLSAFDEYRKS